MGKKHFTEEQIAFALRQAESGTSVAEIIRKLGISEQTFYRLTQPPAGGRSVTSLTAAMEEGSRGFELPSATVVRDFKGGSRAAKGLTVSLS